jgi:hypothetical protein
MKDFVLFMACAWLIVVFALISYAVHLVMYDNTKWYRLLVIFFEDMFGAPRIMYRLATGKWNSVAVQRLKHIDRFWVRFFWKWYLLFSRHDYGHVRNGGSMNLFKCRKCGKTRWISAYDSQRALKAPGCEGKSVVDTEEIFDVRISDNDVIA